MGTSPRPRPGRGPNSLPRQRVSWGNEKPPPKPEGGLTTQRVGAVKAITPITHQRQALVQWFAARDLLPQVSG